ncbi:MAG: ferrochelatase [Elusimicrobia bacterium]|nr:ferrochelatase [Elusimicrobiota bacterium]
MKTAVLLMAHGAVEKLEDVEPYLKEILRGRTVPAELLAQVKARYVRIGGKSPLLDITRRQAQGLENLLADKEGGIKVYVGMKHWAPRIKDSLQEMGRNGVRRIIALCLTPYYSRLSVGEYYEELRKNIQGTQGPVEVHEVSFWNDLPLLIQAFSRNVIAGLDKFPVLARQNVCVIFSTHSLPLRVLSEKDPYVAQFRQTVERVAEECAISNWRLATQSKGATAEPWLGPDVGEVLQILHEEGCSNVLLAPIGFISDHMETLYDDDILYREMAESKGMNFIRADSLNDSPLLLEALGNLVMGKIREAETAGKI